MADGVFYIAFGDRFVEEAMHSARSVKRSSPTLRTALFSDSGAPGGDAFDVHRRIEPDHIRAKVDFIADAPFDRALYLDSDTEVVRDIADMFGVLDRFDVAMAHDFSRKRRRFSDSIPEYGAIPYAFPEMNGGMMLFRRSDAVLAFLEDWRTLFHRYREITGGWDQATLRVALWRSGLRVHTLPVEYNVRSLAVRRRVAKKVASGEEPGLMEPRILHWHGLHARRAWSRFSPKYKPQPY